MLEYYIKLTKHLLADIASCLSLDLSRDALRMEARVSAEGLSFLTKSLPRLGKELDSYHGSGQIPTFSGFKLRKDGLPSFLGDLLSLVYPTVKSVEALRHTRQLLYLFYKLELPFDDDVVTSCLDGFVQTDSELPICIDRVDPVLDYAEYIINRVTGTFRKEMISPRHGPGAVSDGQKHWEKMRFRRIYPNLERVFPFFEWFVPTLSAVADFDYQSDLEFDEPTAKVVLVPKDSRGPRIISCEPAAIQYIQQGIAAVLVDCIETNSLTRGRVNFRDQSINQRYALSGSLGVGWVTLDMKDASDRVSLALVRRLFRSSGILEYLESTRSTTTRLPDGRLVLLKKFAPMGSALCFPVEALVFYALAVSVLVNHLGLPLAKACESLKVYGDDIICTSQDYEVLFKYFPTVGLMFNTSKCCITGLFRESCGVEAYNGQNVTPMRIRTGMSSCLMNDATTLASWCAYQRSMWSRGYWYTAQCIADEIRRQDVNIPTLCRTCPEEDDEAYSFLYLYGIASDLQQRLRCRHNGDLQRREALAVVVIGKSARRRITGHERMHWNFTGVSFDLQNAPSFPVRNGFPRMLGWCVFKTHDCV